MSTSNKIFVSPGVYTSEKDLTFVSQSVGLTTLGLVGETLKGPAFEPVLIKDFNEFNIIFGSTSVEKNGNGVAKYILPYVAKSYLEESNQLFVTRVLGLTGYLPQKSFVLVTDYNNDPSKKLALLSLRSRGSYPNGSSRLELQVTGSTSISITSSTLDSDPFGEFTLSIKGLTGVKEFTCSLDMTSQKYVTKVLGTGVFDKNEDDFPLYVDEVYPNVIKSLYQKEMITGFTVSIIEHDNETDFLQSWDTSSSPYVVSEVRGGQVSDLFKVHTISDGDNSNYEVKISILNIDLESGEFDLIVRDFNDTDDNLIVLEKFSRCSLDPSLSNFLGKKVGTVDGEYALKSKYIMLNFATDYPKDAIPAGFRGFPTKILDSGAYLGHVEYKTKYYEVGDVTDKKDLVSDDEIVATKTDKYRNTSLGISSSEKFDSNILKYKGNDIDGFTLGFHLSTQAENITGTTITGKAFVTTEYDLEGENKGKLEDVNFRKFTFLTCGGFDGWDIYRNVRTNSTYGVNNYVFGSPIYIQGNQSNGGVFDDQIGNSDYYAFLDGIRTLSNPESIDVNIIATPGLNLMDHKGLIDETIDMVENDRADALYIIDLPGPSSDILTAEDAANLIKESELDSNYSATYWPWIQVKDNTNNSQLYLPPTGEVLRNFALTDNKFYPWFATAGYTRGLVKSIKAFIKLKIDERDTLYKNKINPIATFSDTGTIIWGNKTLQEKESALDRINVRRLLLRTRKLISALSVRLLFDQNGEDLANEFLRLARPILENIKKERGVYDFRIDASVDPEDIDSNTLRGTIYIKPTKSLEFIDLQFVLTPTGASFENI